MRQEIKKNKKNLDIKNFKKKELCFEEPLKEYVFNESLLQRRQ